MDNDKDESRNNSPVQDLNKENAEEKRIDSGEPEKAGIKSGDLSVTSPGAKNKVKEHHDKNNIGDHSGTGITKPKDDENVARPSGVNDPHSDDETEFVDIIGIDEDENNGLTAAEVLRAQIEAEEKRWNEQRAVRRRQRQAQLDADERRRNEQRSERQRQAQLDAEERRRNEQRSERQRQAQLDAEERRRNEQRSERQRQAQLDAEERRRSEQRSERQRQRQIQTSSSSSNDVESGAESSNIPTID